MKSFSIFAIISLSLILLVQVAVNNAASDGPDYDYGDGPIGPASWGKINGTCSGHYQSPIDIPYKEFLHFSKPDYIKFDDSFNVEVENKLHTVEVSKNSTKLDAKMKIGNDIYELAQFHFHTPSEHKINGLRYDVEAHFVFVLGEKISVIGVFYDVSDHDNEFLKPIIANIPREKGKKQEVSFIKLSSVLKDINDMNEAFTYNGSLTTPPCLEGVTWWVNRPVQPIGKGQYNRLHDAMGPNSRPVQTRS